MNKGIIWIMMAILTIGAAMAEPFLTCYEQDGSTLILVDSIWQKSYDYTNSFQLCIPATQLNTLYIAAPVNCGRDGQCWPKPSTTDIYTTQFTYNTKGNINADNTVLSFDYYMPSYNGQCTQNRRLESILVSNHNLGFAETITFDDALYDVPVVCDSWQHFSMSVSNFRNDWGSSFVRSKTVGSISFELANVYIKNVVLNGRSGTTTIW